MSAFVISARSMDRCVAAILHKGRYGKVIRQFCSKAVEDWEPSELGRALYRLNTRAVGERYKEESEDMSSYEYTRRFGFSLVEGIKALNCLVYQCSEGDVPETESFKELERVTGELCNHVVRESDAYEQAPWGD